MTNDKYYLYFFCFSSSVSLIFASTSSASHLDLSMYSCYIVYVSLSVYVLSVLVYIFKITLFENIVNECLKLVSERFKVHSMQKKTQRHTNIENERHSAVATLAHRHLASQAIHMKPNN